MLGPTHAMYVSGTGGSWSFISCKKVVHGMTNGSPIGAFSAVIAAAVISGSLQYPKYERFDYKPFI